MRRNKQLSFTGKGLEATSDRFGGSLLTSNPKVKRPLDSKWPTHLVLRANESVLRSPKTFGRVNQLVHLIARKYGIRIYEYANVGNHLHLIVRTGRRSSWAGFIRELTGRIALFVRSANAGSGQLRSNGKISISPHRSFWRDRPFTEIIRSWRKGFQAALDYLELNRLEAEGHIKRAEIKSLNHLRLLFSTA